MITRSSLSFAPTLQLGEKGIGFLCFSLWLRTLAPPLFVSFYVLGVVLLGLTRTYNRGPTNWKNSYCYRYHIKPKAINFLGSLEKMDGCRPDSVQESSQTPNSQALPEEMERKASVDTIWQQMNKGVSAKSIKSMMEMHSSTINKSSRKNCSQTSSAGWMGYLGLGSKTTASPGQGIPDKPPSITQYGTSEDAKRHAAAALAAVKDAAGLATAGKGKVEVTEVRDFAGEEIEVKKLVDAASKEAVDKGKTAAGAISAVDAVLEQIKKKPKLSVLDKTKKDWGEFKDDNTGMEDELDAYKKSSNQYLDKVTFLQRTDYREFERERDARLAAQSKRKVDMRDD